MPTFNPVRRSERIPLAIPITVSGRDASGRSFKERSRTLIVNKHGGLISVSHKLEKGSHILIENPALSRSVTAKVIQAGDGRLPDAPFEAGVEVDGAGYLWPAEFNEVAARGSLLNGTNGDKPEKNLMPPTRHKAAGPPGAQAIAANPVDGSAMAEHNSSPTVMAAEIFSPPIGRAAAMQLESKPLEFPSSEARSFTEAQGTSAGTRKSFAEK